MSLFSTSKSNTNVKFTKIGAFSFQPEVANDSALVTKSVAPSDKKLNAWNIFIIQEIVYFVSELNAHII